MRTRMSLILVGFALVTLVVGCSKAPETAMQASEDALQRAQAAEADQYAPEAFQQAADSLNAAKVEAQKQESRFSLLRSYGETERLLDASQQLAEQAIIQAEAAREETRQRDSVLVANIESLIATTKQALAAAPRGKGTRADLELINTEIASAEAAFASAVDEYTAGKYLSAESILLAVEAQLTKLQGELEAAKAKVSRR